MRTEALSPFYRGSLAFYLQAIKVSIAVLASLFPAFRSSSAAPSDMQVPPLASSSTNQVAASSAPVVYYVGTDPNANDSNSGLSIEQPLKTLQAAHSKVKPGDGVNIGPGIYRQSLTITKSGTPDKPIRWLVRQPLSTLFTGADIVPAVTRDPSGVYSFPFPHKFLGWCGDPDAKGTRILNSLGEPMRSHPCNPYHELRGRAEQVIVEGVLLKQVLKIPSQLGSGEFYVSPNDQKVYLRDRFDRDLTTLAAQSLVETSTRATVVSLSDASYNYLQGFNIKYAANPAQLGAVMIQGNNTDNNVLRQFKIEKVSGDGLSMNGKRHVVANSIFADNGSVGVSGGGLVQLAFLNNKVIRNNTKRYSSDWQAGGMKVCWSRDSLFRENLFEENYGGPGLWFDISVDFVEIDHNIFHKNDQVGLYYEISTNPIIHDNLMIGNGHRSESRAWGADGGLSISNSYGAKVFRNIFVDNKENLQFREMFRTTPIFNSGWTSPGKVEIGGHHNEIRDNYFLSRNRKPHVAGWFNVTDARHWPSTSVSRPLNRPVPTATGKGPLENLALNFTGNKYSKTDVGVPAVIWGPSWSYREQYPTVADGHRFLGIFATEQELPATNMLPVIRTQMLTMGPFISSYVGLVN